MSDERWRRISHLYHDAVALAPANRAAFLRNACGSDDLLRTEVESLLVDDRQWDHWLERHEQGLPQDVRHVGRFIGMYEVRSLLGTGGMGEVYRARDPKLGREVAIKVLPAAFTADTGRLARFEREARILAAVNHPNIGAIYGLEESDGRALVLELVEGPTLGERLGSGPIPIPEALRIAQQIASGLEAAHDQGIVHRDLKPANIKISPSGHVKILDFGLAKQASGAGANAKAEWRTELVVSTRHGVLLGTAAYMSPEQARGLPVDKRADIWSFGCVLYQMLAGRVAFAGTTVADTLAAVLTQEPDWNVLPRAVPRSIRHLLQRCLEKDAATRQHDISGVGQQLERAISARRRARVWIAAGLAGVIVAGAPTGWLLYRQREAQRMEVLIATATRLADQDDYGASLLLVAEAASIAPDDARLSSLWTRVSVTRPVRTVPSGADVYIKRFDDSGGTWRLVGQTPIAQARLPRGVFRWRIQREGYQTLEFIAENHRIPARGETPNMAPTSAISEQILELQPSDRQTPMVVVPTSQLSLQQNLARYNSPSFRAGTFLMGKYEVTNAEFKRFVDGDGYRDPRFWDVEFVKDGRTLSWQTAMAEFHDRTGRPGPSTWEVGTYPVGHDRYPVRGVSWYEAAAYSKFAGASLPTIYHWVRAAGVRIGAYIAPFSNLAANGVTAVGTKSGVSPFGAFDMAGNVREWVWNEMAPGSNRYILGGGWTDPAYSFQYSDARSPFDRAEQNGFRVARYIDSRPLPDGLTGPVRPPARDYTKEEPVSDDVFRAYERLFAIDPEPLDPEVEWIDSSAAGWTKERVSFAASYDRERVPAFLFLPKNARPPYQTVVYFPGADARISRTSEALEIEMFDFLMLSGRAVFFPIYKSTYDRPTNQGLARHDPAARMTRAAARVVVQYNTDLRRGIEYLQTRSDIRKTGFGYYGFSWGASNGPIALALEPSLKAAVFLSGGFQPYMQPPEVDPFNFAPRARGPVLMLNGDNDTTFPVGEQRRLFTLLGTPPRDKRHVLYQGGHGVFGVRRSEVIREVLDWLDRYLGPVAR